MKGLLILISFITKTLFLRKLTWQFWLNDVVWLLKGKLGSMVARQSKTMDNTMVSAHFYCRIKKINLILNQM